ncbi:MAG: M3 family metallopeptidase [Candidatus Ventricola sp.]|nr:M3 family metallopeptidase [Candidatus Ventricola sp.]
MHFRDMPYRRVTYEEIEATYRALFDRVAAVSCEADCLAVLKEHSRIAEAMTPIDLCYVRHGMDVNDPFYAQEQAYYDEAGPRIAALENRFDELLVHSPLAAGFELLMGAFAFSLIRSRLSGYGPALIPLEQEENAVLSRYNLLVSNARAEYGGRQVSRGSLARDQQSPDAQTRRRAYDAAVASWAAQRDELEEIYDSLVKNRDRQARLLGFPSFVELSYLRMNRIGYPPADVRCFREQVKALLAPLAARLNERRRTRLGLEHLYPCDGGVYFPEGNPMPLGDDDFCLEMTRRMYASLSPETGEYIGFMLDNGLCDVTMREGKQSGGYCTQFEVYRAPFIFANFDGTSENAYICDPDTGLTYRDSEYAQQTLCEVYGVESVDDLTGYNREEATRLLQAAYDQCYADGNISDTDIVEIEYHVYGTDSTYQKMVDFIEDAMLTAAQGTSLEGRIKFVLVEDQDYYNTMQSGQDDMINGAWGGAEMDPYSMMICWTDPAYIMEYGFNPYQDLTISVQGAEITMSYYDWYDELYNGAYAIADLDVRNEILAGMEKGLLLNYHMIPIFSSCGASLASHRLVYGSEDYINTLVGRGGIQFMTYTMDDAEWAAYCAGEGNQLSY